MLFTTGTFLFGFLPLVLAGFYLMRRRVPLQVLVGWLALASFVFYGWWRPDYILLLLASIIVNYGTAKSIEQVAEQHRKALLIAGVTFNLALIAIFKYLDFAIGTVNVITASDWPLQHVVLPLAISFFTFQQIAFLADVHAGAARVPDLNRYILFVSFFPQLIAGPIVHHAEMVPQFDKLNDRRDVWEDLAVGATIMLIGLFKKIIIADQIAPYSTRVFDAAEAGTAIGLIAGWQGALAFTVQIYFDFSGYTDMAIGLARMFGVRLPANFASPYKARSIMEFWRHWHITLSRFLRDYLYFPLGGNRKGRQRRYANMMVVMVLGGLWHGAGWTFVLWGTLHGTYLILAHAWRRFSPIRLPSVVGWALTMLAVVVAWVFFRAESFPAALNILSGMLGLNELTTDVAGVDRPRIIWISIAILLAATILPNTQQILRDYDPVLSPLPEIPRTQWVAHIVWQPRAKIAALAALAAVLSVMLSWETSEFLYFQF